MNVSTIKSFNPIQGTEPSAVAKPQEGARAAGAPDVRPVSVGTMEGGIGEIDRAADVPESELRRDDALGALVSRAFNLPAPPAPAFTDGGS